MLAKEIREKSVKELITLLDETSLEYFKLKMQFRDVNFNTYTRLAATLLQPEIFLR